MKKQTSKIDISIFKHLHLQPVSADETAAQPEGTINLSQDIDSQPLDEAWDKILKDMHGE
ncbi:MAG TPA: hypothetical protein PLY16_00450 [Candidatus Saccharibacteria bacterium]|nr:hypothetical protein [Candidatus Saccharibacteria bacterium]